MHLVALTHVDNRQQTVVQQGVANHSMARLFASVARQVALLRWQLASMSRQVASMRRPLARLRWQLALVQR